MHADEDLGQTLIITQQSAASGDPAKTALYDPALGKYDESVLIRVSFGDNQFDTFNLGCPGRFLTGIALVGVRHFDGPAGLVLHFLHEGRHLISVLFIGRACFHRQRITQCIDRQMELAASALFASIEASTRTGLRGGLQRSAVENAGSRADFLSCASRNNSRKSPIR